MEGDEASGINSSSKDVKKSASAMQRGYTKGN